MTEQLAVVVLAAGMGKRFRSATPKVLHKAAGRSLILRVLDSVTALRDLGRLLVVVGRGSERVIETVESKFPQAVFVDQPEQLGTGDAVKRCETYLGDWEGPVLIVSGDTPLVRTESLQELVDVHRKSKSPVSLLTAILEDPTGYGRIVRDESERLLRIVEETDASPEVRVITEVSTGIWCFEKTPLFEALTQIDNDNSQGEYYLPDAALVISAKEGNMYTVTAGDADEVQGVNDRAQLADVSRQLRLRYLEKLAASGITIEDPNTTYIDEGIDVGPDTVIRPLVFLEGATSIGRSCVIGPSVLIADSIVEDGAEIVFSQVKGSHIGPGATVGPFASLRPGTRLGAGAKAGTFVEVKGSIIGERSKVPHLSYIGDTEIGSKANIGAGTITGNYDGETGVKSKTVIEDGVLTGSGTTLVAPVTLGKESVTGAGSVVTKDVGPSDVVVGVPARVVRKRKRENEGNKKEGTN